MNLLERYRHECEMSKAGVIKGDYAMDVVYPSIAIGMAYGTLTAFLVSALVLALIDLLFTKPHILWRSGMLVVVLAGLFLFFLRETPSTSTNRDLLWVFLFVEIVLAVFSFYYDLLSYRQASRVRAFQKLSEDDEDDMDQQKQDLLRSNESWSRSIKILNMLIVTIILVLLAALWFGFSFVQGVFPLLGCILVLFLIVSRR